MSRWFLMIRSFHLVVQFIDELRATWLYHDIVHLNKSLDKAKITI